MKKFTLSLIVSAIAIFGMLAASPLVHAAPVTFPTGGGTGTNLVPTCGNVLIGNASGTYTPGNLAAGTNVTITTSTVGGSSTCVITFGASGGGGGGSATTSILQALGPVFNFVSNNGKLTFSTSTSGGSSTINFLLDLSSYLQAALTSLNGATSSAQTVVGGTGISVGTVAGVGNSTTTVTNTGVTSLNNATGSVTAVTSINNATSSGHTFQGANGITISNLTGTTNSTTTITQNAITTINTATSTNQTIVGGTGNSVATVNGATNSTTTVTNTGVTSLTGNGCVSNGGNSTGTVTLAVTCISGNQTITFVISGDATGTASGATSINDAVTVTGLNGKVLPANTTGTLQFSGGAWKLSLATSSLGLYDSNGVLSSFTGSTFAPGSGCLSSVSISGAGALTGATSTCSGGGGTYTVTGGTGVTSTVATGGGNTTTTVSLAVNGGTTQTCAANNFVNALSGVALITCGGVTGGAKLPTIVVASSSNNGDFTTLAGAINAANNATNYPNGALIYDTNPSEAITSSTLLIKNNNIMITGNWGGTQLNWLAASSGAELFQGVGAITGFALVNMTISQTSSTHAGIAIDKSNMGTSLIDNVLTSAFKTGIKENDTLNNTFYNLTIQYQSYDDNCILASSTNPINENTWMQIRCGYNDDSGATNANPVYGLLFTNGGQQENFYNLDVEPANATGTIGISITPSIAAGNFVNDMNFYGLYAEANATSGILNANTTNVSFWGGQECCHTKSGMVDNGVGNNWLGFDDNFVGANDRLANLTTGNVTSTNIVDTGIAANSFVATNAQHQLIATGTPSGGGGFTNANASSGIAISTTTSLISIQNIGVTSITGGAYTNLTNSTGSVTINVSSTLASSSISFGFPNATTTAPQRYEWAITSQKKNIALIDCAETAAATTTMEVGYATTIAHAAAGTIDTVILPSIVCGNAGNSTTTFSTASLPALNWIIALVSSTIGTPTLTTIDIVAAKQ